MELSLELSMYLSTNGRSPSGEFSWTTSKETLTNGRTAGLKQRKDTFTEKLHFRQQNDIYSISPEHISY